MLLFIAIPLPRALPPIVNAATNPVVNNVIASIFKLSFVDNIIAIDDDNAPLIIPHISPITSLQKLIVFLHF